MTSLAGNDDFTFATYDASPSSGNFGLAAHQLGRATISGITITAGTTNTVNVALQPIIATFTIPGSYISGYIATAGSTSGVSATATDVDGNSITAGQNTVTNGVVSQTDTYANPIVISVTDNGGSGAGYTGHVKLTLNGGSAQSSITLTKSTDTFGLAYDGLASNGYYATISAMASGATSPPALTFSFLYATASGTATSATIGASSTVSFNVSTQSETITLTEPNFAGTFSAALTNYGTAACPTNSMAVHTGSLAGSGTSFTLMPGSVSTTSLGCQVSVHDGTGGAFTIFASTTYGSGGGTIGVPNNFLYATTFGVTGTCNSPPPLFPNLTCASGYYVPTIERVNLADGTNTDSFTYSLGGGSNEPLGIAHDSSGNIYVADYLYHYIIKFAANSSGTASPLALMSGSSISGPDGLGVDSSGNIYVADNSNGTVLQYAPLTTSLLGTATPSKTIATGLTSPTALTLDSAGNVYVVVNNAAVNEYAAPNFTLLRTFSVSQASGVAVDPSGDVFIAQCCTLNDVVEYAPGASTPTATFSSSVAGFAYGFTGIAVDGAGHLYVMGTQNGSGLMQYGIFTIASPSATPTFGTFASPTFSSNESVANGYGSLGLMSY
jgi:sugar lactone lactonase YvrE